MMGVGKSTVGKKLAKKLKLKFIDIDHMIEKKEKRTIKEIFENKGEGYFRKIEKKISLEELKKSNAHLTQLIFSQDQENLIVDFIKNDIAINVIKKSVRDLLAIIKNGIKIQIIIKSFSNKDLLFRAAKISIS